MMFGMISVFAEFERAMIRSRVVAGLDRVRGTKRLGRPPMPTDRVDEIKRLIASGKGIRETARRTRAGITTVQRIKRAMVGDTTTLVN
jgi:DNA invertase Pin-like site-specific DNA recombinase